MINNKYLDNKLLKPSIMDIIEYEQNLLRFASSEKLQEYFCGDKMSDFEIIKAVPLKETKRLKYLKYLLEKEIDDPNKTQSYIDDLKESIRKEEIQRDKMYLHGVIKD